MKGRRQKDDSAEALLQAFNGSVVAKTPPTHSHSDTQHSHHRPDFGYAVGQQACFLSDVAVPVLFLSGSDVELPNVTVVVGKREGGLGSKVEKYKPAAAATALSSTSQAC